MDELNEAARREKQFSPEPILITTNGAILAGLGRWRLALFEGRQEIHCIEYRLSGVHTQLPISPGVDGMHLFAPAWPCP